MGHGHGGHHHGGGRGPGWAGWWPDYGYDVDDYLLASPVVAPVVVVQPQADGSVKVTQADEDVSGFGAAPPSLLTPDQQRLQMLQQQAAQLQAAQNADPVLQQRLAVAQARMAATQQARSAFDAQAPEANKLLLDTLKLANADVQTDKGWSTQKKLAVGAGVLAAGVGAWFGYKWWKRR